MVRCLSAAGAGSSPAGRSHGLIIRAQIHSHRSFTVNCSALLQTAQREAHPCQKPLRLHCLAVRAGKAQRYLSTTLDHPPYRAEQQRPARQRLSRLFWLGAAHKEVPAIINQCHAARRDLAAQQVLRPETAPAPLVLRLVIHVPISRGHAGRASPQSACRRGMNPPPRRSFLSASLSAKTSAEA